MKNKAPGCYLDIRVTTNASKNTIEDLEPDKFKVYVTCSPEDGKANKAIIRLLAKYFKVSQSDVDIVTGQKSRNKRIFVRTRD